MKAANWGRIIFISSESAINIPGDDPLRSHQDMQVALVRGSAETTLDSPHREFRPCRPHFLRKVEKFLRARTKNVTPEEIEKEFFHTARPGSLLQRFATTDEVAALVAFIASPLSSAINGAALRAEGGVVRSIF